MENNKSVVEKIKESINELVRTINVEVIINNDDTKEIKEKLMELESLCENKKLFFHMDFFDNISKSIIDECISNSKDFENLLESLNAIMDVAEEYLQGSSKEHSTELKEEIINPLDDVIITLQDFQYEEGSAEDILDDVVKKLKSIVE